MKVCNTIILSMIVLSSANSFLTETETKILLCMIRNTNIKNMILAPNERLGRSHFKIYKQFSTMYKYFTLIINRGDLRKQFEKKDFKSPAWTIVVFKKGNESFHDYVLEERTISSYFWIIYDDVNGNAVEELRNLYVPINSVLLIFKKVSENRYILKEFYKIKKESSAIVNDFAEWKDDKLIVSEVEWYDRKSDLKGFNFTTIKSKEDFYISPRVKANEEIWKELARLLNFTVAEKLVEFGSDEQIDGDEEEKAFLDPQIYIKSTKKDKYLLGPTAQSKLYIHVKVFGENTGFTRIIRPFSRGLWVSTCLWLLILSLTTFVFEYLYEKLYGRGKNSNKLILMTFIPFYSLCNQTGLKDDKYFTSSTFLLFLIRISSYVLDCAYAATLLSYLLLYIPNLPFTDLEGFVKDGNHKIEGERNSEVDTFFNISQNPLERLVYEKFMSDPETWSRFDKGLDRMCRGEKLVLIGYDNDIDRYTPCPIVKIKKPLKVFASGFKIRPRSPFKELLQIKLMLMQTTGILKRINRKMLFGNSRHQYINSDHTEYEIKLEKVFSIFHLLTWGTILSVIILLVEIVTWKMTEPGKKRKRRIGRRI